MDRLVQLAEQQIALSGAKGCSLAELVGYVEEEVRQGMEHESIAWASKGLDIHQKAALWAGITQSREVLHFQWLSDKPLPVYSCPDFPEETLIQEGPERGLLCERAGSHWLPVHPSVYSVAEGTPGNATHAQHLQQVASVEAMEGRYLLVATQQLRNEILGLEGGGATLYRRTAASSNSGIPLRIVRSEQISNEQYAVLEYIGKHGRKGVIQSKLFHCFGKKASHIIRALRLRHRLVGRTKVLFQEEQDGAFTNNFLVWLTALAPEQVAADVEGLARRLDAAEKQSAPSPPRSLPSSVDRVQADGGWPLVLPLVPMQLMVANLLGQATAQTLRCRDVQDAVMLHSKARWRTFKKSLIESGIVQEVKVKVPGAGLASSLRLVSAVPTTGDDNEGEEGDGDEGEMEEVGTPVEYSIDRLILRSVQAAGTKGTTQPEIRATWRLGEKLVHKKMAKLLKQKKVLSERQHYGRKQVLVLYTPDNFENREQPDGISPETTVDTKASPDLSAAKPMSTDGDGDAVMEEAETSAPVVPRTTVQQRQREQLILEHVQQQSFALKRSLSTVLRSIMLQRGLASPDGPRLDVRTTARYLNNLIASGALEMRKVEITNHRGVRVQRELIVQPGTVLDMPRVEEQLREAAVFHPSGVVPNIASGPRRSKPQVIELDALDTLAEQEPALRGRETPIEAKQSSAAVRVSYGYIRSLGLRLATLHRFLVTELLPKSGSLASPQFPELSEQFSISHMLDRMPVSLFAQTIGIASLVTDLDDHIEAGTPLGLLPVGLKADVFEAGGSSRLYQPFGMLVDLGLVKRDNRGSTFVTVAHWVRFEVQFRQHHAYSPGLEGDALTALPLHSIEAVDMFWRTVQFECAKELKSNSRKKPRRRRKKADHDHDGAVKEDVDMAEADDDDDEEMVEASFPPPATVSDTVDVGPTSAPAAAAAAAVAEDSPSVAGGVDGVVDVRNAPKLINNRAWASSKLITRHSVGQSGERLLLPFPALEPMSLFSPVDSSPSLLTKRRVRQRSSGGAQKRTRAPGRRKRREGGGAKRRKREWSDQDSLTLLRRFVGYYTGGVAGEEAPGQTPAAALNLLDTECQREAETEKENESEAKRAAATWQWVAEELPHSAEECRQRFRDLVRQADHRQWVRTRLEESALGEEDIALPQSVEELMASYSISPLSAPETAARESPSLHSSQPESTDAVVERASETEEESQRNTPRDALLQATALSASITSDLIYQPTEHRRLLEQFGQQAASEKLQELRDRGVLAASKSAGSKKNFSASSRMTRVYDALLSDYSISSAPHEVADVCAARRRALDEGIPLEHREAPAFSEPFYLDAASFTAALEETAPQPLPFSPMASGGQVAAVFSLASLGQAEMVPRVADMPEEGIHLSLQQLTELKQRRTAHEGTRTRCRLPAVTVEVLACADNLSTEGVGSVPATTVAKRPPVTEMSVLRSRATAQGLKDALLVCSSAQLSRSLLSSLVAAVEKEGPEGAPLSAVFAAHPNDTREVVAAALRFLALHKAIFRVCVTEKFFFVAADHFQRWAFCRASPVPSCLLGSLMRPWIRTDGSVNHPFLRAVSLDLFADVAQRPGVLLRRLASGRLGVDLAATLELIGLLEEDQAVECRRLEGGRLLPCSVSEAEWDDRLLDTLHVFPVSRNVAFTAPPYCCQADAPLKEA